MFQESIYRSDWPTIYNSVQARAYASNPLESKPVSQAMNSKWYIVWTISPKKKKWILQHHNNKAHKRWAEHGSADPTAAAPTTAYHSGASSRQCVRKAALVHFAHRACTSSLSFVSMALPTWYLDRRKKRKTALRRREALIAVYGWYQSHVFVILFQKPFFFFPLYSSSVVIEYI